MPAPDTDSRPPGRSAGANFALWCKGPGPCAPRLTYQRPQSLRQAGSQLSELVLACLSFEAEPAPATEPLNWLLDPHLHLVEHDHEH